MDRSIYGSLEELSNYSGIYIGGGNTYKLLKIFKETGFDKLLKNYQEIIFGGSAGVIVLGKSIDTCSFGEVRDENTVNLEDTKGLDLLNGFSAKAHYKERKDELIINFVKKFKSNVLALKEGGVFI